LGAYLSNSVRVCSRKGREKKCGGGGYTLSLKGALESQSVPTHALGRKEMEVRGMVWERRKKGGSRAIPAIHGPKSKEMGWDLVRWRGTGL